MRIDWIAKASHLLQTLAFCLAASAIQFAFRPERPYEIALVYSLAIGSCIWLLIDFGREWFASSRTTGWPQGHAAWLLPLGSVVAGYVAGTLIGDTWFGWSSWRGIGLQTLPASLLITALAGTAASYYFYTRTQSSYLTARMTEAHYQAAQARLKMLETQLEPHMLFNTLANLRVLIDADPARAQVMLDHLIAYLRATLNASRASTHALQAEFARLRDYLELMAVRMGPRLSFSLELPAALASAEIPTLLLQPLVENAIQHGLEPKVGGGKVTVRASRSGAMLALEVHDTGMGLAPGALQANGFGLTQVRERLQTAYGTEARLAVLPDAQAGVGIRIELPLRGAVATG
ncbi:histidine kinase [Comamonadaceae bacterium G21597-S1]|nr:histidine kinase [Comamonadaceae bacterium G21597-S1]